MCLLLFCCTISWNEKCCKCAVFKREAYASISFTLENLDRPLHIGLHNIMSDVHGPTNDILNLIEVFLISKNEVDLSDSCKLNVVVLGVQHLSNIRQRKRKFGTLSTKVRRKLEMIESSFKRTRNSNYFIIPEGTPDNKSLFKGRNLSFCCLYLRFFQCKRKKGEGETN